VQIHSVFCPGIFKILCVGVLANPEIVVTVTGWLVVKSLGPLTKKSFSKEAGIAARRHRQVQGMIVKFCFHLTETRIKLHADIGSGSGHGKGCGF